MNPPRVTSRNLVVVLDKLRAYASKTRGDARQEFCDGLNWLIDDLVFQDAFSADGDPRGDPDRMEK